MVSLSVHLFVCLCLWFRSMRAVREKEGGLLTLERRHAGAHDLVDEEEIRCDDRARVEELNFHSVKEEKCKRV